MVDFFGVLKSRKNEIALDTAASWQKMVVAVADGKKLDADLTLLELSRLGKTPDDLAAAVALLGRRRAWAAMVDAGDKAAKAHSTITQKIESEVDAFEKQHTAFEARIFPMEAAKTAAAFEITEAGRARGELMRTATCPVALATVRSTDAAMQTLRQEQADGQRELLGKQDRLVLLQQQCDRDMAGHVARLKSDIEAMTTQLNEFRVRGEQLNSESVAARTNLLRPEAI